MITSRWAERGVPAVVGWWGLGWVYSGALWLVALAVVAAHGWALAALAIVLRLAVTLTLGIGLCAMERWGWASIVGAAALYVALAGAAAARAAWTLLTLPPGTLSWQPVFFGLPRGACASLLGWALAVAAIAGVGLRLMWGIRGHFDVPDRRAFTVLLQEGAWPAVLLAVLDSFLLYGWWLVATGSVR
jgi:hypothetical protein